MKTFNPFTSTTKEDRFPDFYTFGIEYEFWASREYFNQINDSYSGILGVDGAGKPTGEYRSPVFKSSIPRIAVNGCIKFSNQVLDSLVKNYKVELAPTSPNWFNRIKSQLRDSDWCTSCNCWHTSEFGDVYESSSLNDGLPLGVHFSLGGKFLTDGNFNKVYSRAIEVQQKLQNVICDVDLLLDREKKYSSDFNARKSYGHCNALKLKDYPWDVRIDHGKLISEPEKLTLVEFRFFPSCDYNYLWPYLRYVVLGGNCPEHKIPSLRTVNYGV